MANDNIIHIGSEEAFDKLITGDVPVLVDFWATWCGPCRMLGPVVSKIAEEYEGKIKVGKVNVDDEQELAMQFGISAIPTVILFKGGQPIGKFMGYMGKPDVEAFLAQYI